MNLAEIKAKLSKKISDLARTHLKDMELIDQLSEVATKNCITIYENLENTKIVLDSYNRYLHNVKELEKEGSLSWIAVIGINSDDPALMRVSENIYSHIGADKEELEGSDIEVIEEVLSECNNSFNDEVSRAYKITLKYEGKTSKSSKKDVPEAKYKEIPLVSKKRPGRPKKFEEPVTLVREIKKDEPKPEFTMEQILQMTERTGISYGNFQCLLISQYGLDDELKVQCADALGMSMEQFEQYL